MNIAVRETAQVKLRKHRSEERSAPARAPRSTSDRSAVEIAQYVAEMSAELADLAGKAKLDTLAYFLAMARLEAELKSRRS